MKSRFYALFMITALLGSGFSSSAFAGEKGLMNLFPKGRAAYLEKSEEARQKYEARGYDYTLHLYSTGGEEPMPDAENDDTSLDNPGNVEPVDVKGVASIIRNSKSLQ